MAIHSADLGMTDSAVKKLQQLFVDDFSGNIDYEAFLRWARTQPGLCSRHRSLICPLCFYVGYCRKCRHCTRYREVKKDKVSRAQGIYKIAVRGAAWS